ncbi:MAG: Trk system potassium transporter TrkA [Rickettsiales bacterium]|nr:Trk system potassium transporter TrkA [Rickettsiales bacterium]
MKIIVCGAGEVGSNIAKQLVSEDNDVTIIDESEELLRSINQNLDVKSICGKPSYPSILEKADAEESDMLIAVSDNDEVNIISCQVAESIFKIPVKIARIKESNYLNKKWSDFFSKKSVPIDVLISPELEIAKAISRKLNTPGAFDSMLLGDKLLRIIGLSISADCPVINTPLRMFPGIFSGLEIKILVIFRNNEIVIPSGKVEIYPNDEIYFAVRDLDLGRALRVFGIKSQETRKVVIVGAGNIGLNLIKIIEKNFPDIICKVIESNLKRSEEIVNTLSEQNIILNGNALDLEILEESGVGSSEAIIAVTDDDEVNVFSTLLAKELGCPRSMAIVNNSTYRQLSKKLNLDIMISPKTITTSAILQYVRRGKIKEIHDFGDNRGEIIEFEILQTSKFVDKKISELELPKAVVIGAIVRNKKIIFPDDLSTIQINDKIILYTDANSIKEVEKLSEVKIEFF